MGKHERRRLVGDRFRRVWALCETIFAQPGLRRAELAGMFHLSERQVQADLNIIRDDMRLPLVRDGGYRFASEGGGVAGPCPLTLKDGLVAITTLGKALPVGRRGQIADVLLKLPHVFPSHVQPLMRLLTSDVLLEPERRSCLQPIVAAALAGRAVRLHYAVGRAVTETREPVVTPDVLLPHLGRWYVVGARTQGHRTRTVMWPLDGVVAVTYAAKGGRA